MDDLTLEAAVDLLRDHSEDEARRIDAESDRRLAAAGDSAAQQVLERGAWVTYADEAAIVAVFEQEIRDQAVAQTAKLLEAAILRDALLFADASGLVMRPTQVLEFQEAARRASAWLPKLPEQVAPIVEAQMRGAVTGRVPVLQVVDGVRREIGGTLSRYARTMVDTTLQTMDQVTIDESTKGLGYELDLYAGPDDVLTRPFCEHCVNRAFPRAALVASDNGQIPGVPLTRGGYNCRHRIRPITRRTADYLKIQVVDPWALREEEITAANPKRGTPARLIRFPVPA